MTGIIPACAGNTRLRPMSFPFSRDHPRVCGEHPPPTPRPGRRAGSSPRVRGTLLPREFESPARGIIPACAGNTEPCIARLRLVRDHPRVCGEHGVMATLDDPAAGSSPRVRGTPERSGRRQRRHGIIPACAGNTRSRRVNDITAGDHPRVCGEHTAMPGAVGNAAGSSPRVRGTRHVRVPVAPVPGIIPACAGNTSMASGPSIEAGDHPRVCGEHTVWLAVAHFVAGSSPRVRGTRDVMCCKIS